MSDRRKANIGEGVEQCPYMTPNGDDGYLCCGLEVGHGGDHETAFGGKDKHWRIVNYCDTCGHELED